jgi:cell division septation protein DedD
MRDAEQIREASGVSARGRIVAAFTVAALSTGAAMFAAGYVIGGRAARLDIAHEPPIDAIARLDAQRKLHGELTFYDALTEHSRPSSQAPAQPKQPTPALVPRGADAPAAVAPRPAAAKPAALASAGKGTEHRRPDQRPEASGPARPHAKLEVASASTTHGLHAGPAHAGEYTVQVSAHQSAEEARASCAALERRGLRPFVVKGELHGRGVWYRVRVGRFIDAAQAQEAKALLAQADVAAWVLRHD